MKRSILALAVLALLISLTAAQYQEPRYIFGGDANTSSAYMTGLAVGDVHNKTVKHLTTGLQCTYIRSVIMDANNKDIVFVADKERSGPYNVRSGIYRLDPGTLKITTLLYADSTMGWNYSQYRIMLNQDGEYIFGTRRVSGSYSSYHLMKLDKNNQWQLLMDRVGGGGAYTWALGKNCDTGNYLVSYNGTSQSANWKYPVLEIDIHKYRRYYTFSNGGGYTGYGWDGEYGKLQQNFATGAIEQIQGRSLNRLVPGTTARTTLYNCGWPAGWGYSQPSVFDLQSAPVKRHVQPGWIDSGSPVFQNPGVLYTENRKPYWSTGALYIPGATQSPTGFRYHDSYAFDFYRGRNIQTLKTGTGTWDLLISCPAHPGKVYTAVISLSGIRPGIQLPDGRTINLKGDFFTQLSMFGWLKPFFDAGPLKLDAGGEAVGSIDMSSLPPTGGMPMWIAVAVLDPAAPGGIAFIPDTFVFRLP